MDPFSLIALVLTIAGSVGSYVQGQAAADAQEDAIKAQQNAQAVRQTREREQVLREARIKRGALKQQASNQGVLSSSGTLGGLSSISNQQGSNMSFLETQGSFATQETAAKKRAVSFEESGNAFAAVAGLGSTLFSNSKEIKTAFGSLFDGK